MSEADKLYERLSQAIVIFNEPMRNTITGGLDRKDGSIQVLIFDALNEVECKRAVCERLRSYINYNYDYAKIMATFVVDK